MLQGFLEAGWITAASLSHVGAATSAAAHQAAGFLQQTAHVVVQFSGAGKDNLGFLASQAQQRNVSGLAGNTGRQLANVFQSAPL
jgi:hypothetical protein